MSDEAKNEIPEAEETPVEGTSGYDLDGVAPTEEPPEEDAPEPEPSLTTAFIVVVDLNGKAMATNDLSVLDDDVVMVRAAELDDIFRACGEVGKDVQMMQQSQHTVFLMQQAALQTQEAIRQQKMAASLAKKGIKVPGRG